MKLVELSVVCDQCHETMKIMVSEMPEYSGKILRSFWCRSPLCKKAQVIKYKFTDSIPEVTEHIEPSLVLVEQLPQIGITIKPRGRSSK